MEILVCVKQVPDTAEVKIDPVKHTVIRAGVPNIFNPFDQNALEAALALKDADKDVKITLLSMGPDQAKDVLREGLAMGADDAYLLSDRKLGGSDTLATGYALAQAIKMKEFSKDGKLTDEVILSIMQEDKPNQKEQFKMPKERISKYFAPGTPAQKIEDTIIKALELYRKRERQKGMER